MKVKMIIVLMSLMACLLTSTASLAQRIDYSDSWLVTSSAVVAGCGITDESYTSYGHEYSVTSTLTSPSGRTAVTSGGIGSCMTGNPQCSRADVSLSLFDGTGGFFDNGEFFIETLHEGYCPNYAMTLQTLQTNGAILIGISVSVLTKAAMSNWYTKITGCNVHCPTDEFHASTNMGPRIISAVPYTYFGGYICGPINAVASTGPTTQCGDYDGWVSWPF